MAKQGTIKSFTSKGSSVPSSFNKGRGITPGVKNHDGRIIRGPKPQTDKQLLASGGSVRVVNGAVLGIKGKRTQTLGRGGAEQMQRF
jgi:hypothetical protein